MKSNIFYKGPHRFCWPILLLTVIITTFGIFSAYSASYYNAEKLYGDSMFFVSKQIIGVVLGAVAMILCYFIDYQILKKLAIYYNTSIDYLLYKH